MEGKGDDLETIDVSELMKGLDDDDARSPRTKQVPPVPLPKQKARSAMASANLPLDSFTLEPEDVAEVPPWLSSFNAQRGMGRPVAMASSIGNSPVFGSTPRSKGGSSMVGSGSSSHPADLFGDKLSVSQHAAPAPNPDRSLSFEAYQQKDGGKSGINAQKDVGGARQAGKGLKVAMDSSSSRLIDSEGAASPLNAAALPGAWSLKRWLQYDNHLSKGAPELKPAPAHAQPKLPPQKGSPPMKASGSVGLGNADRDGGGGGGAYATRADAGFSTASSAIASTQSRIGNSAQQSRRRQRHSFTGGNRDPQFAAGEDRSAAAMVNNRPSSWELEKVMVDPKMKVVLYSTSAQADVHAYEDSNAVRAILISLLGSSFDEKSVSQHPEFEQELRNALNTPTVLVPTVCVRGRYIAGVDNIMQLYKKGVLGSLVQETLAHGLKPNAPCACRGGKFLICTVCKGKRKLVRQGEDPILCRHCSGTGLIKCPSCLNS